MIRRSKSTVPYRSALLLKDGTLLEHPEALAHFQLFTLNPNLNVATFDMASIDLSGGLDADGYFHSMKWFSDKVIEENMKLQEKMWKLYGGTFDEGGTKETWKRIVKEGRKEYYEC